MIAGADHAEHQGVRDAATGGRHGFDFGADDHAGFGDAVEIGQFAASVQLGRDAARDWAACPTAFKRSRDAMLLHVNTLVYCTQLRRAAARNDLGLLHATTSGYCT